MFKRGDFVKLKLGDHEIDAMVTLASPNGRSLMLMFDGALTGSAGVYLGMMPVFLNDDGTWIAIMGQEVVTLTPRTVVH